MDEVEALAILSTQDTKMMRETPLPTPPKKQNKTKRQNKTKPLEVPVRGKQFLLLIGHPSCDWFQVR